MVHQISTVLHFSLSTWLNLDQISQIAQLRSHSNTTNQIALQHVIAVY